MQSNDKETQHKVCASDANGLTNVQSVDRETQHKVCVSEANGLTNVQSDRIQT